MKRITKRQMLSLMRKAQRFQIEDGGKHRIYISLLEDKGTKNFHIWGFIGKDVVGGSCYSWREYEKNVNDMEKFFEVIRNN